MVSTITFTGICDFTRSGSPGVVTVILPDCTRPKYSYLMPHVAYLKVARTQLGQGSTFKGDKNLSDDDYAVAAVTGQLVLEGTFAPGLCDSNAMVTAAVPDMRNLTAYNSPMGQGIASICLSTGTLVPSVLNPTVRWNYGFKDSPAPSAGEAFAAEHVLTVNPTGSSPALRIYTPTKGIVQFKNPSNAFATIGCLEASDILSTGPYHPKAQDLDFLFHHSLAGGVDEDVNLIPLLVPPTRKPAGKKVDCFAARWF